MTSFKKRLIFWKYYYKLELIIELTRWRRSRTEIVSSNTLGLLTKKSDIPSEKVRKSSGDLDYIRKSLVTTIDTVVKEGTTDTFDKKGGKPNMVINPVLLLLQKKTIDTVNKTRKSQASNEKVDTSKINKTEIVKNR